MYDVEKSDEFFLVDNFWVVAFFGGFETEIKFKVISIGMGKKIWVLSSAVFFFGEGTKKTSKFFIPSGKSGMDLFCTEQPEERKKFCLEFLLDLKSFQI